MNRGTDKIQSLRYGTGSFPARDQVGASPAQKRTIVNPPDMSNNPIPTGYKPATPSVPPHKKDYSVYDPEFDDFSPAQSGPFEKNDPAKNPDSAPGAFRDWMDTGNIIPGAPGLKRMPPGWDPGDAGPDYSLFDWLFGGAGAPRVVF